MISEDETIAIAHRYFHDAFLYQTHMQRFSRQLLTYVNTGSHEEVSLHRYISYSNLSPFDYFINNIREVKQFRDYNLSQWAGMIRIGLQADSNFWNSPTIHVPGRDIHTLQQIHILQKVLEFELKIKFPNNFDPFKKIADLIKKDEK